MVAVTDVAVTGVTLVAAVAPERTAVAPVYVYWSPALVGLVPAPVVTFTSTVPAEWLGMVAVTDVALTTVTLLAAVAPNETAVEPGNPVPVMVIEPPPAALPEVLDS